MIESHTAIWQALEGTLFTWFVTALGAAVVFLVPKTLSARKEGIVLDASLGFAAGVMLAASYFSLLAPALEFAERSQLYGDHIWLPVCVGFIVGALFVFLAEGVIPEQAGDPLKFAQAEARSGSKKHRRSNSESKLMLVESRKRYKRILLMVLAVTIHNFPEGVAVGVGFGGIEHQSMSFVQARLLALGIGIQNFPEGLAVSLPMRRLGYSRAYCFFLGQMSGMVEPIGGILGAYAVSHMERFLPYALSFAAGAMVYVVFDSIVPESRSRNNGSLSSWGCIIGFCVMMALDVALG